jgi:cytochrome P450
MSRDTNTYSTPETFDPSRFLREDGSFTKRNELPTWGFGGRKCSAMHLAEATLFINIVTMLWAFDFVPPLDANGEAILPSLEWQEWEDISPW